MPISMMEMRRRVVSFRDGLIEEAKAIVLAHSDEIVQLNRSQMYFGLNGNAEKIGYYKDRYYAQKKHSINPAPGYNVVDLRYTGDFYRKMELKLNGDGFILTSSDKKAEALAEKYGNIIFKLGPSARNEVILKILQPGLVHAFADKTGAQIG